MIVQVFTKTENKSDFQIVKIIEKTVIDAIKMSAVEAQNISVRSTVSPAILQNIQNTLDNEAVAGLMQKAAVRAVVHPSMIETVYDALLKNDSLMASIANFVLK